MAANLANDDSPSKGTTNGGVTSPGTTTKVSTKFDSLTGKNRSRENPLSKLSSYTYNITLYAVTPKRLNEYFDAYDNGSKFDFSQDGFYIVAQSGGVGSSEKRAITLDGIPGAKPGYDYYIDDLTIETLMPTKDGTKTSTADMNFTFKIVEPIGFNFLFQLRAASDMIIASEKIPANAQPNQYQHKYMIGIRFYGYDVNGNIQTAKDLAFNDDQSGLTNSSAVYERFFPIEITSFSFKLDGRATVYNIQATAGVIQTAFTMKRGIVKSNINISGTTVGEILSESLATALNNNQQAKLPAEDRDQYVIEFEKNSRIAAAYLVDSKTPGNTNSAAPTAQIKTTNQSTVAVSNKSQTININAVTDSINSSKSIVKIIDNIITNSTYITKTLSESATSQIEADANENSSTTTTKFNWYTIVPKAEILKRSSNTKDWVYKITYFIKEYAVPYIRSPYVNRTVEFYGAVKTYNYWYTGLSSEVKSLDFTYNNLYYNIIPIVTDKDSSAFDGKQGNVPVSYQNASDADIGGSTVDNKGSTYNQNVNGTIYNAVDNNVFKIKILGDPDFLMTTIATPVTNTIAFAKMYGPGFVVNPMDGSIFVEINFNSAYDYENDGLLHITNAVQFYTKDNRDKLAAKGITGLIMEVNKCTSSFSRGSFLQDLEGILLDETVLLQKLGVSGTGGSADQRNENQSAAETARLARSKPTNSQSATNTVAAKPSASNNIIMQSAAETARLARAIPTTTKGVVNDDASQLDVNTRLKLGFGLQEGRETESLINKARKALGIPVGGTNPRQ